MGDEPTVWRNEDCKVSRWGRFRCFVLRHAWQRGARLSHFSKSKERRRVFRGCSRCGLQQSRVRISATEY